MESQLEKLTVLMVASSYPRFEGDTASIFLRNLAQHVARTGVRVHVLAPSDAQVRHDMDEQDVKIHYFRYFPKCSHMLAYGSGILPNIRKHPWLVVQIPFFLLSMFFALLVRSRKIRPQIIHAHWIVPVGFVAVLVGKLLKIPVIVTAHGGDAFGLQGGLLRSLKNYTIKHSQAWTANTLETARAAFEINGCDRKLNIIPMGVDVQFFSTGDRKKLRKSLNNNQFLVLFVGRLVEKKGVEYLIEAVAYLKNRSSVEILLWIVGDGERESNLKTITSELGISESVVFVGRIGNEELPDYYAAADLFVAPSIVDRSGDTEGQGVVIIEAMSAGVPVVASNVGGITDIIDDGETGFLVGPADIMSLANTLHDCVTRRELAAISEKAQKKVKDHFDWVVVAKQFKQLYVKVNG